MKKGLHHIADTFQLKSKHMKPQSLKHTRLNTHLTSREESAKTASKHILRDVTIQQQTDPLQATSKGDGRWKIMSCLRSGWPC